MARLPWNGKRTIEHCSIITNMRKIGLDKPEQHDGKCGGYTSDNLPFVSPVCTQCKLWYKNSTDIRK